MGRRINENRKELRMTVRIMSPCHRSYIDELANVESVKSGRVVSLSNIVTKIICEKMTKEGVSCA